MLAVITNFAYTVTPSTSYMKHLTQLGSIIAASLIAIAPNSRDLNTVRIHWDK